MFHAACNVRGFVGEYVVVNGDNTWGKDYIGDVIDLVDDWDANDQ